MTTIECGTCVEVTILAPPHVAVTLPSVDVSVSVPMTGPPGPPGQGYVHTQSTPAASWIIAHPIGRVPDVALYIAGEQVDADITADATTVTITLPEPTSGIAVLT